LAPGSDKETVREKAKALRKEAAETADAQTPEQLSAQFLDHVPWKKDLIVGGYWPIGDEIDPRELLVALDRAGCGLALPVVVTQTESLIFRTFRPGYPLELGAYGIPVPAVSTEALVPSLLLVPLLAFDRSGHRLGYGGGYYDRTIQSLRGQGSLVAVGLAYAAQEVPIVPREADDEALDWVITEREAIETKVE
jgi:5-formyltetrahydrofolate cyclo-ligase